MKKRTAFVTGVCGQDGSYLSELLLEKNYEVYGLKRRTSGDGYNNAKHLLDSVNIVEGDLSDQTSLNNIIKEIKPDEVYNLAAQSHVGTSFKQPLYTADVTGLGVLRLLEAIKEFSPTSRFYQASSSELFGSSPPPQNEQTIFHPRSPYGLAKQFGYWATVNYREAYNMFACNGILFNHEGARRGFEFVTRKITNAAAKIKLGLQDKLILGNLDAQRDIGSAKDYVEGMWLMLQAEKPDDYVLATGETHSIKEMLDVVFEHLGLDWNKYVEISQAFYRPSEVNALCGDYSKAKKELGWEPKTNWKALLIEMVENDLILHTSKNG
jgi:GDPmannose 4,6-dehydratase